MNLDELLDELLDEYGQLRPGAEARLAELAAQPEVPPPPQPPRPRQAVKPELQLIPPPPLTYASPRAKSQPQPASPRPAQRQQRRPAQRSPEEPVKPARGRLRQLCICLFLALVLGGLMSEVRLYGWHPMDWSLVKMLQTSVVPYVASYLAPYMAQ